MWLFFLLFGFVIGYTWRATTHYTKDSPTIALNPTSGYYVITRWDNTTQDRAALRSNPS